MVDSNQTAWLFLAYLLIPLVVLFFFWIVALVLRKVFKRGDQAGAGEEE